VTAVLPVAVIVALGLDALTWSLMPAWAELNPLIHGMNTPTGWGVKVLLMVAALSLQLPLRPKYAAVADLLIVASVATGCIGAGSNLSVLAAIASTR
jgi:hypothetical protein